MRKPINLLMITLSIITSFLTAQSYAPLPLGQKSTYTFQSARRHRTAPDKRWEEVWVQETQTAGSDTVFIFNKQVKPLGDGESCSQLLEIVNNITHQPSFLGMGYIKKPDGLYGLINPFGDTLWIYTNELAGYTWNAKPHAPSPFMCSIQARIYAQASPFPWDSIVQINLGNGKRLDISKKYGVTYFDGFMDSVSPNLLNDTISKFTLFAPYRISGYKTQNTSIGKHTGFPMDAYKFDIGDVFVYKNSSEANPNAFRYEYLKVMDIVLQTPEEYVYKMHRVESYNNNIYINDTIFMKYPASTSQYDTLNWIFEDTLLIPYSTIDLHSFILSDQFNDYENTLPYNTCHFLSENHITIDTCPTGYVLGERYFEKLEFLILGDGMGIIKHMTRLSQWAQIIEFGKQLICFEKANQPSNTPCNYYALGIDENMQAHFEPLCIYPNPAHSFLKIRFHENIKSPEIFKIFNSTGECIKNISVNDHSETEIGISEFPPGIYWIYTEYDSMPYYYTFVKSPE